MLSILIPVYNFQISNLIKDLLKQIRSQSLVAEILILDDASQVFKKENQQFKKYQKIKYFELNQNKGRSFARNFLANHASYNYLLFIDCDAQIVHTDFLSKYYNCIKKDIQVVCGGLIYPEKRTIKKDQFLRWFYGVKKESKSLSKRKEFPYRSFSSFNFLIKKNLFLKIKFPEQINTYGHEDTFLGITLKKQKIPIEHINNPLIHVGLEDSKIYIKKIELSVRNIDKLLLLIPEEELLEKEIRLFKYIKLIKDLRIVFIIKFFFKILRPLIIINLLSKRPSLILLDFYKLGFYFIKVDNK